MDFKSVKKDADMVLDAEYEQKVGFFHQKISKMAKIRLEKGKNFPKRRAQMAGKNHQKRLKVAKSG